jgi:periplasmic copper chaperone A
MTIAALRFARSHRSRRTDGLPRRPGSLATIGLSIAAAAITASTSIAATSSAAITNGWIRWLPGGIAMAGYATIVNTGAKPVAVVGARSAAFGDVSLHQTVRTGTQVEMRPVERLTVPAHATVVFETAGYHLMLSAPKRPVEPGSSVPISLLLHGGETLTAQFDVRNPGGTAADP